MEVQKKAEPVTNVPPLLPRRKKHRHGSLRRGRLMLLAIFFVLLGTEILMYLGTPKGNKSAMLSSMLTGGIWTIALLIAIACRKNWARYILGALLIFSIIGSILFMSVVLQESAINPAGMMLLVMAALVNGAVLCCLIYSLDIRRLTDRN